MTRVALPQTRPHIQEAVFLILLIIATVFLSTPLESRANPPGIVFYSPSSPPAGLKSFEPS
ncbi:MAG: hypothetical protein M3P08_03590 [Thermoproteota archaeon]|nr:hypothetical protein [Thermoproteota archaeon]